MRKKLIVSAVAATLLIAVAGIGGLALGDTSSDGTVGLGEHTTIEGLTYSVVATKQRSAIAIPEGLTYTARKGVYLIVELKLENASGGAARAVGEYVALVGGDGERYLLDEDGSNAYHLTLGPHRHDPALYDPARPDPVFGFFDVPAGTTRSASATFDVSRKVLRNNPLLEIQLPDGSRTVFELGL